MKVLFFFLVASLLVASFAQDEDSSSSGIGEKIVQKGKNAWNSVKEFSKESIESFKDALRNKATTTSTLTSKAIANTINRLESLTFLSLVMLSLILRFFF